MTPPRRGPSQQRESNVTERAAASFFGLLTVFLVSHRLRLLRCGDSLPSHRGRCLCPAPLKLNLLCFISFGLSMPNESRSNLLESLSDRRNLAVSLYIVQNRTPAFAARSLNNIILVT